jgi:AraC-like DNA-binding protein
MLHLIHDSLWKGGGDATDEWKASRLRIRVRDLSHTVSDSRWDSAGRAESDYLHHIDLVCDGHAQVIHGGNVLDLRPGYAYLFPGNTPTQRRCAKRYANYYLRFRVEWFPGIDVLAEWPGRQPIRLGRWNRREWERVFAQARPLSLAQHMMLQAQLALWLSSALPSLGEILAAHIRMHARFERVFLHVEHNVRADLRVAELARVHGTALHAFSIAFRRAVGFSPKHYIDRRLNEEVVWRLLNTDAPVRQIAADLGFSNEYYFSRFCSRMNGQPPARLRRNLLGPPPAPA